MTHARQTTQMRSFALAFAVVLSPAFLQVSCQGDTSLTTLEVEVDGHDQIVLFNQGDRSYAFTTRSDTATLTAAANNPGALVTYQWVVGGSTVAGGALGAGGGTAVVTVPDGPSSLRVNVTAVEGNIGRYTVDIVKLDSPEWGPAEPLATIPSVGHQIAIDADGDAVAIWERSTPLRALTAAQLNSDVWEAPEELESDAGGTLFSPRIAMAPNGDAVAVWTRHDGIAISVFATRLTAGVWGTAEPLETHNLGHALSPEIAMADNGDAVVIWEQVDAPAAENIYANRLVGGVWQGPELLSPVGFSEEPTLAVAANGDAVALFNHDGASEDHYAPYANRLVSGAWAGPERLQFTSVDAGDLRIALAPNGDGLATWAEGTVTRTKRLVSGQWIFPGGTVANPGRALNPRLAVDGNGDAMLVFSQDGGVYANHLPAAIGGWLGPERIDLANSGPSSFTYELVVDGNGNALATWRQLVSIDPVPRYAIYANRQVSGVWGAAEKVELDPTANERFYDLAVNANGDVVSIWTDASLIIFARRLSLDF